MGWQTDAPVVVPIDFSGMSVKALEAAMQMAARPELIHVVHVVPTLDQIVPNATAWDLPSDEDRRDAVRRHFSEFLAKYGFKDLREVVLDGWPGEQITDYATEVGAGVIVISSHGFHGIKRLLLGSVAEKIIRLAACPVFVLRREDAE